MIIFASINNITVISLMDLVIGVFLIAITPTIIAILKSTKN